MKSLRERGFSRDHRGEEDTLAHQYIAAKPVVDISDQALYPQYFFSDRASSLLSLKILMPVPENNGLLRRHKHEEHDACAEVRPQLASLMHGPSHQDPHFDMLDPQAADELDGFLGSRKPTAAPA